MTENAIPGARGRLAAAAILLLSLALPLWGQATPSISQGAGDRRDVVSLREYIDVRITGLREVIEAASAAQQRAIDKAEESINRRLEGVPQNYVPKAEFANRTEAVDGRIKAIENEISGFRGSLTVLGGLFVILQIIFGAMVARWVARQNGRPKAT